MSVSKNKPIFKVHKKSLVNDEKSITSLPEQNGQTGEKQKRKRNRFKNIDWNEVLDFDTLASQCSVYEVPWMQTTKKRKRVCKSSDKQSSDQPQQTLNNEDKEQKNQIISSNDNNNLQLLNLKKNIEALNLSKSKEEEVVSQKQNKKQKKSFLHSTPMKNENTQVQEEKDLINDENTLKEGQENVSKLAEENGMKKTRLQSQKERESKVISDNLMQEQKESKQNITQAQKYLQHNNISTRASRSSTPQKNDTILNSSKTNKIITQQQQEANQASLQKEKDNKQPVLNKKQTSKTDADDTAILNKSQKSNKMILQDKDMKALNNSSPLRITRQQSSKKYSPSQFGMMNEEANAINQCCDDSDASTRDEDHHDINYSAIKGAIQNNNSSPHKLPVPNKISSTRQTRSSNQSQYAPNNQELKKNHELEKQNEKNKIPPQSQEEDQENDVQAIQKEKKQESENDQSIIIKKSGSSIRKTKQLKTQSTSAQAGEEEDNQGNQKKEIINNNNKKTKKKLINKKQINNKPEQIIDLGSTTTQLNQNHTQSSNQTEAQTASSTNNIFSNNANPNTQRRTRQNKKSRSFVQTNAAVEIEDKTIENNNNNLKSKENNNNSERMILENENNDEKEISSLSDCNIDKIDEEIMVNEESGFENSNNIASAMIPYENKDNLQQYQDQQQVPHLYIRNSDYATKVGTRYQSVIPELGTYDYNKNNLKRLITEQKVWGKDWIDDSENKIKECTTTLKQWYGHRRNQEQCIKHLLLLGFDTQNYNNFLEENQDTFYTEYNQMDAKYYKKKAKKRSLYSCK